jgi:hypothetical protein
MASQWEAGATPGTRLSFVAVVAASTSHVLSCSCVLQAVGLEQQPTLRQHPVDAGQPDGSNVSDAAVTAAYMTGCVVLLAWCAVRARQLLAVMFALCGTSCGDAELVFFLRRNA